MNIYVCMYIFKIKNKHITVKTVVKMSSGIPEVSTRDKSPAKSDVEEKQVKEIAATNTESRTNIIDQVRKWDITYNGTQDPLEFTERLEELSAMYCINLNYLPPIMPELLAGRALIWFRNNNDNWDTWEQYKNDFYFFFLPPKYFEKKDEQIQQRKQRLGESFKNYVLSMQNLMRHSGLDKEEKLDRIFKNTHPDYHWHIRKQDFSTLSELIAHAEVLEGIKNQSQIEPSTSNRSNEQPAGRRPNNTHNAGILKQNTTELRPPVPPQILKPSGNQTFLQIEEERITASILIGKIIVCSTIDTGASRNFIKPDLVKKLGVVPKETSEGLEVVLADGSIRKIDSYVDYDVILGNSCKRCKFFVMPCSEDIILGLEFLRKFDASINCAGLHLNLNTEKTIDKNKRIQRKRKHQHVLTTPAPVIISSPSTSNASSASSSNASSAPKKKVVPADLEAQNNTQQCVQSQKEIEIIGVNPKSPNIPLILQQEIESRLAKRRPNQRIKFVRKIDGILNKVHIFKSGNYKVTHRLL